MMNAIEDILVCIHDEPDLDEHIKLGRMVREVDAHLVPFGHYSATERVRIGRAFAIRGIHRFLMVTVPPSWIRIGKLSPRALVLCRRSLDGAPIPNSHRRGPHLRDCQRMCVSLHILSTGFATMEVEERIKIASLGKKPEYRKQFGFVQNRSGTQKRPIRTVYICGIVPISSLSSATCKRCEEKKCIPSPPRVLNGH